jgi:hypothetical protein
MIIAMKRGIPPEELRGFIALPEKQGLGVHASRKHLGIIAGPCSVETREQILLITQSVKQAPFSIQGLYKPYGKDKQNNRIRIIRTPV